MADSEHMKSTVDRYLAAHTAGDIDGIVALFADDASVWDPVDQPPHVGAEAVRAFFTGAHDLADSLELVRTGPVRCAGDFVAIPMMAKATIGSMVIETDIVDVFTFDTDGMIVDMKAYWRLEDSRTL